MCLQAWAQTNLCLMRNNLLHDAILKHDWLWMHMETPRCKICISAAIFVKQECSLYTHQVTCTGYFHAQSKQECDRYHQNSQTFGKPPSSFSLFMDLILPPGYIQKGNVLNLRTCDFPQIGGGKVILRAGLPASPLEYTLISILLGNSFIPQKQCCQNTPKCFDLNGESNSGHQMVIDMF